MPLRMTSFHANELFNVNELFNTNEFLTPMIIFNVNAR